MFYLGITLYTSVGESFVVAWYTERIVLSQDVAKPAEGFVASVAAEVSGVERAVHGAYVFLGKYQPLISSRNSIKTFHGILVTQVIVVHW